MSGPSMPPPLYTATITPDDLRNLILSSTTPQAIQEGLLPLLHSLSGEARTTTGGKSNSTAPIPSQSGGEEVIALKDVDLSDLNASQMSSMTTGLVYILSARMGLLRRGASKAADELFQQSAQLCVVAEHTQLMMCKRRLTLFARGLLELALAVKKPELALDPLFNLISRLARHAFTGVHAVFLEACLLARSWDTAMPVIDEVFMDFFSMNASYLDVMTFHHHAGLICAAQQLYAKARDLFLVPVTMPTTSSSAIQLACIKRATLCEILATGKILHLPRYTSSNITRLVERQATTYDKLGKAFSAEDWALVHEVAKAADFQTDCNRGLVDRILASITSRRILKLTETYSRMSVSALLSKIGRKPEEEDEVLSIIQDMVNNGVMSANVSPAPNAIITFQPNKLSTSAQAQQLVEIASTSTWLTSQLQSYDKSMGLDTHWLKRATPTETKGKGKGGDSSGRLDSMGWKESKLDDVEAMMMEDPIGTSRITRSSGLRGVGANMGDMGF